MPTRSWTDAVARAGRPAHLEPEQPAVRRRWRSFAGNTRAQVVLVYLVLLALSGAVTVFGIRELLARNLSQRTEEAMRQEVAEVERLLADGRDPANGQPFDSLTRAFEIFLSRNVPSNEEAFLTFVDGELHRMTLERFPVDDLPVDALEQWAALSASGLAHGQQSTGEYRTEEGTARFRALHLEVGEQSGAFVITMLPVAEANSIRRLQTYGVAVTACVVLAAAALAWFVTGRVLAPVYRLTDTARSISTSDWTRRAEATGGGEAAEMARAFNAMLDRLDEVYDSQLEFLRAAGHELRAPVTVAVGHLEVMSETEEERLAATSIVLDELRRAGRILDDLHSLASAVLPDFVDPQPLDLEQLSFELFEKSRVLADRDWQLESTAQGTMLADRDRLAQAVLNLADNAVKHTGPGDTIAIGLAATPEAVRIWVRDTGVGISPAEHERIFDRFERGRDARKRYRGAGLGLAIVKNIAEAHGGEASIESEIGKGATFTLDFPRRYE